ncbi:MAG TPA: carboxypeptidase regulatory-like domain-containing protein [Candidatus Polarisedimenticolia bacterium]|jgi:plastocyanin
MRGRDPAAVVIGAAMMIACADPSSQAPAPQAGAIPAGTVLGTAAITGRVVYTGEVKAPEPISMDSDATCHRKREGEPLRENLVVGPGGAVRYSFVRVATGLPDRPFAPPARTVTLDQRGCTYRPHVVGVQVGQPLIIVNSDATLHNVHTISQANKPFNFGMSVEGQKATRYFTQPEVMIKAKCDVHPWMAAWIGVASNPFFAVTGEDGGFTIAGVPAGEYEVEAWHETLGTQSRTVRVGDGEHTQITFTFPG